MNDVAASPFRLLPSVHAVLADAAAIEIAGKHGAAQAAEWARKAVASLRSELSAQGAADRDALLCRAVERVCEAARGAELSRIGPVINATGVVLHTGLGRAPLADAAVDAAAAVASAGNIEVDLQSGERRYRGHQLQPLWRTLTGCEDSLVVNNNAAATLLTLQALCSGREVVIPRGQLIEIGGSFRLPDIFQLSGAKLVEVGTTNRTRLADYANAVGPDTAALMHVHTSNYRIVGFTESPEIEEIAGLARERGLIAIDDIGSGALADVTKFGLPAEPTFADSLSRGADVVLGSGDKLLGGPQAGIVLGRSDLIERIRKHPLARAVRVDKLTLAALAATLELYVRDTAEADVPTLMLLATDVESLHARAESIVAQLANLDGLTAEVQRDSSPVGGGSLPGAELPTAVVSLAHGELAADELSRKLRVGSIRVFARVQHDRVLLDLRSVRPEDDAKLVKALREA